MKIVMPPFLRPRGLALRVAAAVERLAVYWWGLTRPLRQVQRQISQMQRGRWWARGRLLGPAAWHGPGSFERPLSTATEGP